MKIVVIADTHIPIAADNIPPQLTKDIIAADMVLHAGDLMDMNFLKQLEKLKPVVAVAGNMDSAELKRHLETKKIIALEGIKIGLIHGEGAPYNLLEFVKNEFKDTADLSCVIYGHSHNPSIDIINGVVYFNPGSPTDKVFAAYNSYGILDIKEGKMTPQIIRL